MKNYLVIGASSGIGEALAEKLAESSNVFGTFNKNQGKAKDVTFHHLDVTADQLDLSWLPESLDGLAYCPGSINLGSFKRMKPESFVEDYQLQVVGAVKVIQSVMPNLKKSGQGAIVLFSTVAVQTGFNFHSQVAASKGAIEGLTRALAAELAPSIRVNCVAPSLTDTPLAAKLLSTQEKKEANAKRHPMQKIGEPKDIAEMSAFLLSENAAWITGQVLHIDGGVSSIKN